LVAFIDHADQRYRAFPDARQIRRSYFELELLKTEDHQKTEAKETHPTDTRLIERWLPIAEIGEESVRERRSMTALPPTYYLHVW